MDHVIFFRQHRVDRDPITFWEMATDPKYYAVTTLKVTAFEKGGAWVKAPWTGKAGDLRGVLQRD